MSEENQSNKDCLQRFLFEHEPIRGEYVNLHASLERILTQHQYPALIRQYLSEALCAAALLSAIIKFKGRLTIQFRGEGLLKLLLAQCDHHLQIRGLAKWEGELTETAIHDSFKQGILAIIIDVDGKNSYQGVVDWHGKSLAESLEAYFLQSEQLATKINLTVTEHDAYGLLLQIIPGENKQSEDLYEALHLDVWQRVTAPLHHAVDLANENAAKLLQSLYPEEAIRLFSPNAIQFKCTCSLARSENALLLMGQEEVAAELNVNREIVVTCDFCNQQYIFNRAAVKDLFAAHRNDPSNNQGNNGDQPLLH